MNADPITKPDIRVEVCSDCYCCGSRGSVLFAGLRDGLFSAPGTWSLKKCPAPDCGLLWLDPMPREEDLYLAYGEYYTHGDPERSAAHGIAKLIYRFFADLLLSLLAIPSDRKRSALMFLEGRRAGALLDVGCGDGRFLAKMRDRGWTVSGVDFDPNAVEAARKTYGLEVFAGTLSDVINNGVKFDVVTASHVIEHVADPVQFLKQCRDLLRPGGQVVLKTPNAASLGAKTYKQSWRGLEPPRHLHIFTEEALRICARRAGFSEVLCFTTPVAAEGMFVASRYLRRTGEYRPQKFARRYFLESKFMGPLLAIWAKLVWLFDRRSGEELCVFLSDKGSPSV